MTSRDLRRWVLVFGLLAVLCAAWLWLFYGPVIEVLWSRLP